jgi:hypothetical protein
MATKIVKRGSKFVRASVQGARQVQAQHRDPDKVAEALLKAEKAVYNMRGVGGYTQAWEWLGDMLRDATGLSGSFYQDAKLTELKDKLYKLDHELMNVTPYLNAAAKRIKKEHAENEKKKQERGY